MQNIAMYHYENFNYFCKMLKARSTSQLTSTKWPISGLCEI